MQKRSIARRASVAIRHALLKRKKKKALQGQIHRSALRMDTVEKRLQIASLNAEIANLRARNQSAAKIIKGVNRPAVDFEAEKRREELDLKRLNKAYSRKNRQLANLSKRKQA